MSWLIDFLRCLFSPANYTTFGTRRSSGWPKVRREHLVNHPACEACGTTDDPEVHHKIPVHIAPDLELDAANLITLCGDKANGCHYRIGHALRWRGCNPRCEEDAAIFRERVEWSREYARSSVRVSGPA